MTYQNFVAFYPSRPFWMDEAIDLTQEGADRLFEDAMKEIRYSYESKEFLLKISRDGAIMIYAPTIDKNFPIALPPNMETPMERWRKYLEYINAFYLLLDATTVACSNTMYFTLHEITLRDAFPITLDANGKVYSMSHATSSYANLHQMDRHRTSYPAELPLGANHRLKYRSVIKADLIDYAVSRFKQAVAQPQLMGILSSFSKSLSEFKDGNFETSLVLSWFLIESHINALWKEYLKSKEKEFPDKKKRINAKRLEILTGTTYTASIVIQQLELTEVINWETYLQIDEARKMRNSLAHVQGTKATLSQARDALRVAHSLIEDKWNLDFPLNSGLSISGI